MVYLEKFVLPDEEKEYEIARRRRIENGGSGDFGYLENGYPCALFGPKELSELDFETVTILYGGNGSGKSTLLNLIGERLGLARSAPCNRSELFTPFAMACRVRAGLDEEGDPLPIPEKSAVITSDDVFEYMLALRAFNAEVADNLEEGKRDYAALKFGSNIRFTGMDDYEDFRLQVLSRRKSVSRRKFLQQTAGREVPPGSNGETAVEYFETHLQNDTLYCLDEPENSLSPRTQQALLSVLERKSRYCGCQLILATHSPFFQAMPGAKIYDLDARPVRPWKWWELENPRVFFEFFYAHRDLFLKGGEED